MKRFTWNSLVLIIVMIVAAASLSVPLTQAPVDINTVLPGQTVSMPVPVLLGLGISFAAIGILLILMLIRKMNARRLGVLLIAVGAGAMIASIVAVMLNRAEDNRAAAFSEHTAQSLSRQISMSPLPVENQQRPETSDAADPNGEGLPEHSPETADEPRSLMIDGADYIGVLSIPALGLELPVGKTWSYPALKLTPCRYSGSIENNSLVIAGHNYQSHFGSIGALDIGRPILLTDVEGTQHMYHVVKIEVVQPYSVSAVTESEYDLTLFTCTPNGQQRIVVRCMRPD